MAEYLYCSFCGKPTKTNHHLIFGNSQRALADADEIYIPLCDPCHNMAAKPEDRVHGNPVAEKLSKMLGQALWEKKYILAEHSESEARSRFMERYGRSYL